MALVMTFCSLVGPRLEGSHCNCRYLDPSPIFEVEAHTSCCLALSVFFLVSEKWQDSPLLLNK